MKQVPPPDIIAVCRTLQAELGNRGAARKLGISRMLLLAVLAKQAVLPGSMALLREGVARVRGGRGPEAV